MTRHYCDHCGKEIKYNEIVRIEGEWYYRGGNTDDGNIALDLCIDCAKKTLSALKVTNSLK